MKDKINLNMNTRDCVIALSEGNPGALSVLMQLIADTAKIDPDGGALGHIGVFLQLDAARIYGSRIWMLYKDLCGQRIDKMLLVLRACQLGEHDIELLKLQIGTDEARGNGVPLRFEDFRNTVQKALPGFQVSL